MAVGVVGFNLISMREKKRDNMRKGEVLSGRNKKEVKGGKVILLGHLEMLVRFFMVCDGVCIIAISNLVNLFVYLCLLLDRTWHKVNNLKVDYSGVEGGGGQAWAWLGLNPAWLC